MCVRVCVDVGVCVCVCVCVRACVCVCVCGVSYPTLSANLFLHGLDFLAKGEGRV